MALEGMVGGEVAGYSLSVSLILLVGLPCWTTFLLVSLEDKLMPREREREFLMLEMQSV